MVIKRKKDCKIIYDNDNYYVESEKHFFKFTNLEDAQYFYYNINKIAVDVMRKTDVEGKMYIDFYKDDVELLLKGIEQLKFFLDKSLYFSCDKEILSKKSTDCYYLYQYLYSAYLNRYPKEKRNL